MTIACDERTCTRELSLPNYDNLPIETQYAIMAHYAQKFHGWVCIGRFHWCPEHRGIGELFRLYVAFRAVLSNPIFQLER